MKKMFLAMFAPVALALAACGGMTTPPQSLPVPSEVPVVRDVCAQINSQKFDLALKSYGVAVDAINLLIDKRVIVPGTPMALGVANANDKVLAAFAVAERARRTCNADSFAAALEEVKSGIAEVKVALKR